MQNIQTFRSNNSYRGFSNARNVDASEIAFFTNELTTYDPRDFEVIKADLTSFSVFPQTKINGFAETYTYNMTEGFGKAKYAAVKAGKADDAPFVGTGGKQHSLVIKDLYCAAAFSDADILASQSVQRDVIGQLMRQAQRANLELMNGTCFGGNTALQLPGVINNPNVLPIPVTANKNLATGTSGADLLTELARIVSTLMAESKNLIKPNIMLVAPAIYTYMTLTIGNGASGNASVLSIFEGMTGIKVVSTPELSKGVINGNAGANQKEMAILFNNNPDYIEHVVAELFAVKPPQPQGMEYISYCYSRHGGIVIRQPKAIAVITNLS